MFTECAPVKLSRYGVTSAFTGTAGVREMAESRLRAARIWGGREDDDGEADPLVVCGKHLRTPRYVRVSSPSRPAPSALICPVKP